VRYLIKGILKNDQHLSKYFETSKAFETVRGQVASKVGLGQNIISRFFAGIAGILKNDPHLAKYFARVTSFGTVRGQFRRPVLVDRLVRLLVDLLVEQLTCSAVAALRAHLHAFRLSTR
jgi:hypothetical protein